MEETQTKTAKVKWIFWSIVYNREMTDKYIDPFESEEVAGEQEEKELNVCISCEG